MKRWMIIGAGGLVFAGGLLGGRAFAGDRPAQAFPQPDRAYELASPGTFTDEAIAPPAASPGGASGAASGATTSGPGTARRSSAPGASTSSSAPTAPRSTETGASTRAASSGGNAGAAMGSAGTTPASDAPSGAPTDSTVPRGAGGSGDAAGGPPPATHETSPGTGTDPAPDALPSGLAPMRLGFLDSGTIPPLLNRFGSDDLPPRRLSDTSTDSSALGLSTTGPGIMPSLSITDVPPVRLPRVSDVIMWLDPCASGGHGCPDGVRGRVLGNAVTNPFEITDVRLNPEPGLDPAYDLCRRYFSTLDRHEAFVAIYSTAPAEFVIGGTVRGRAAGSELRVLREINATTANAERDHWESEVRNGRPNPGVITCRKVWGFNPGDQVFLTVRGRPQLGGMDEFWMSTSFSPATERPPVVVQGVGDLVADVVVPLRGDLSAVVGAVETADGESSCRAETTGDSPSFVSRELRRRSGRYTQVAGFARNGWDRYDIVTLEFPRTARYDVCVLWTAHTGRRTPIELEVVNVQPPARFDLDVELLGITRPDPRRSTVPLSGDPISLGELRIDLLRGPGAPVCRWTGPDRDVEPSPGLHLPICSTSTGHTGDTLFVDLQYRGLGAVNRAVPIQVGPCGPERRRNCTGIPQYVTIRVPGGSDLVTGYAQLRIGYTNPGVDHSRPGWVVGTTRQTSRLGAADSVSSEVPHLLLDHTDLTPVRTADGVGLRLDWAADREVTVQPEIRALGTCEREPSIPEAGEAATSGTIEIGNLCAMTRYEVAVDLADPVTGSTSAGRSSYGRSAPGNIGNAFTATTLGRRINVTAALSLLGVPPNARPADRLHLFEASMVVNGTAVYATTYEPGERTRRCVSGAWRGQPRTRVTLEVPEEYVIDVNLLFAHVNGRDCTQTRYPLGTPSRLHGLVRVDSSNAAGLEAVVGPRAFARLRVEYSATPSS